jgi:hypothetical protein
VCLTFGRFGSRRAGGFNQILVWIELVEALHP